MHGFIMGQIQYRGFGAIEGDLKFIGETIRRRLTAIKVPYKGKVGISDNNIVFETAIGNYMAAQGQIMQPEK